MMSMRKKTTIHIPINNGSSKPIYQSLQLMIIYIKTKILQE
jgi:hypothetical protein